MFLTHLPALTTLTAGVYNILQQPKVEPFLKIVYIGLPQQYDFSKNNKPNPKVVVAIVVATEHCQLVATSKEYKPELSLRSLERIQNFLLDFNKNKR
jgi:DNA repair exonuclease SbcCD nuclease subunit